MPLTHTPLFSIPTCTGSPRHLPNHSQDNPGLPKAIPTTPHGTQRTPTHPHRIRNTRQCTPKTFSTRSPRHSQDSSRHTPRRLGVNTPSPPSSRLPTRSEGFVSGACQQHLHHHHIEGAWGTNLCGLAGGRASGWNGAPGHFGWKIVGPKGCTRRGWRTWVVRETVFYPTGCTGREVRFGKTLCGPEGVGAPGKGNA